MTKLVYLTNLPVPHQIKLCEELNHYLETQFWFYEDLNQSRPEWWKIPLNKHCRILNDVLFKKSRRYLCFNIFKDLNKYNPDIVLLGGFSIPTNFLAYLWAVKNRKRTIVFTEISRNTESGEVRKYYLAWYLLRFLYRRIDYIFTSNEDATKQFRDTFKFGEKVITTRYATDLDKNLSHPIRQSKEGYTYLFPNRLIHIYNPLLALDIFNDLKIKYPTSKLLMNSSGELKKACLDKIYNLSLSDSVSFIDEIKEWDDLSRVYLKSDILIFPALFSNGNFTINECMASGLGIVISNKINGHSHILEHGKNCFIVNPDKEEFKVAIQNYIDNPNLFRIQGEINKKIIKPLSVKGTALFYYNTLKSLELI